MPDRFAPIPRGSSVGRFDDGRICVIQGANWASVSAPSVDGGRGRGAARARPRSSSRGKLVTWWIGPSARPVDIVERLRAAGLADPPTASAAASPSALPDGARRSFRPASRYAGSRRTNDFVAAREVQWDAFETPPRTARERAGVRFRDGLRRVDGVGVPVGFLAALEGRPAATAMSIPSDARRLPDRRSDRTLGARARPLPRTRSRALGRRRRTRHTRARHAGEPGHLVPDPQAARVRGRLRDRPSGGRAFSRAARRRRPRRGGRTSRPPRGRTASPRPRGAAAPLRPAAAAAVRAVGGHRVERVADEHDP